MAWGERKLINEFLLKATAMGSRLFRFQSGVFFSKNGAPIRVGTPGMSDLMGWTTVKVTRDMVGKDIAIFTAIELKTQNARATKAQKAFVSLVRSHGGISAIAYNWDDFENTLGEFHAR